MKTTFTLDQWDIELISKAKDLTLHITIKNAKEIWARRNKIKPELVHIFYINERLTEIVTKLNLATAKDILKQLRPNNHWKFRNFDPKINYYFNPSNQNEACVYYDSILFHVLINILALTPIIKLPGFEFSSYKNG